MFKKYLNLILAILLINLSLTTFALGETTAEKEAKFAEKVKTQIIKLGTGKESKVEVKLKDGTKLKGYVSQVNENSFIVTDEKTGTSTEVSYPQAKQVKGNNLSTGVKVTIALVVVFGLAILWGAAHN